MRLGTWNVAQDVDDVFERFFRGMGETGSPRAWAGGYSVPTDIFHTDDRLIVRMDLPGVSADDVEVTVQDNNLVVNGKRDFPFDADSVRYVRRGTFYGDFTQKVSLGRGLDTDKIGARFDNGVLELSIPYTAEVQPRRISIEVGNGAQELTS